MFLVSYSYQLLFGGEGWKSQLCQKLTLDYPNNICQSAFDKSSSFKSKGRDELERMR